MQPFWRGFSGIQRCATSARLLQPQFSELSYSNSSYELSNLECNVPASWGGMAANLFQSLTSYVKHKDSRFLLHRELSALQSRVFLPTATGICFPIRHLSMVSHPESNVNEDESVASTDTVQPQRIKFKRLDKTARHIMNILDKEEVEKVRANREIPSIKPGYIVQLKVEVPENRRRVSILKGIVIARRNAGLHTTFRLRRMVAGVGVESVFPLYSPNIKEMKVLDKKDVRRAKLYYLRDRMNALKHK